MRSVESRAAEPTSVSYYQNANSSYYVENANDGSGYPVGTYINASSKVLYKIHQLHHGIH